MKWLRLGNKFLNTKSEIDRKAYNKQRKYCVTFIIKAKQNLSGNINTTDRTINILENSKPFFYIKSCEYSINYFSWKKKEVQKKDKEKVMTEEVISIDYDISWTFKKFFSNLKIVPSENFETTIESETENPVQNAINKFKNYPSIKKITSKINPKKNFLFTQCRTMQF